MGVSQGMGHSAKGRSLVMKGFIMDNLMSVSVSMIQSSHGNPARHNESPFLSPEEIISELGDPRDHASFSFGSAPSMSDWLHNQS